MISRILIKLTLNLGFFFQAQLDNQLIELHSQKCVFHSNASVRGYTESSIKKGNKTRVPPHSREKKADKTSII